MSGIVQGFFHTGISSKGTYPYWVNVSGISGSENLTTSAIIQATIRNKDLDGQGQIIENVILDCRAEIVDGIPYIRFDLSKNNNYTTTSSWVTFSVLKYSSTLTPAIRLLGATSFAVVNSTPDGAVVSWTSNEYHRYTIIVCISDNDNSIIQENDVGSVDNYTITGLDGSYYVGIRSYILDISSYLSSNKSKFYTQPTITLYGLNFTNLTPVSVEFYWAPVGNEEIGFIITFYSLIDEVSVQIGEAQNAGFNTQSFVYPFVDGLSHDVNYYGKIVIYFGTITNTASTYTNSSTFTIPTE
jgi:hypothetical protein